MDVSAISILPLRAAPDLGALAHDPERLAKEFDTLILRMLLGSLGASMTFGSDKKDYGGGAAHSMMGELLADELASKLDLGLGAALLRSSMKGEHR
jgi:hypothetical protein